MSLKTLLYRSVNYFCYYAKCDIGFRLSFLACLACSVRLSWQHRNVLSRARSGRKEIVVPSVYTVGKSTHHNWNRRLDCSRYPILWTTGGNLVGFSIAFEGNNVLFIDFIGDLTLRASSNEGATDMSSLNPRLMGSWRVLRLDVIFSA